MSRHSFVRKSKHSNSFKVKQIKGLFDLQDDESVFEFEADIDLPKDWQIGVIVGRSGTGKTTLAKEMFGEFVEPSFISESMIDDIPADARISSQLLTSVGLSSVPDWLKPYDVLSNGQKMRASLAYALSLEKDIIVFDEFTSVVDREVAKVTSLAVSKSVRRSKKKFVAVTCHYDVIDYLQPDWVFDTEKKRLFTQTHDHRSIFESTKQRDYGQCLASITI